MAIPPLVKTRGILAIYFMKKLTTLSIIGIFLLASIAYAQQDVNVGAVAGQPFFIVKKAFERIQLIFTKGVENKARLRIRFVERRLVELEYVAKNKPENINKAIIELQRETNEVGLMELPKNAKDVAVDFVSTKSLDKLIEIKIRFETDNNTNNDNAIKGLETAIASHLRVKQENINVGDLKKDNVQIDIETNGIATISAVINGKKTEYQIQIGTGDSETALASLSARVGISVADLKKTAQISVRRKGT